MMKKAEHRHFRAEGRSAAVIAEFITKVEAYREDAHALAKEVGAEGTVSGYSVDGFTFSGQAPTGWCSGRLRNGTRYYWPPKRKKADRELRSRMFNLRHPVARDFETMLGLKGGFLDVDGDGICIRHITFEHVGHTPIILVPACAPADCVPPDAVPLKSSEYWALKESTPED